jgi:hypothetical protein
VSNLELLISRYLDGELSDVERQELNLLLDQSPEARSLLREMLAVSRSARTLPQLDTPSNDTQHALFMQLQAEGFAGEHLEHAQSPAGQSPQAIGRTNGAFRRSVAVVAVLLIGLLTTSYWSAQLSNTADPSQMAAVEGDMPRFRFDPTRDAVASFSTQTAESVITTAQLRVPHQTTAGRIQRVLGSNEPIAPERNTTANTRADRVADGSDSSAQTQRPSEQIGTEVSPLLADDAPARIILPPVDDEDDGVMLSAAFLPAGMAYVGNGQSANELTVRVDATIAGRHNFSVIGGRSPVVTERTAVPVFSSIVSSNSDESSSPRSKQSKQSDLTLGNELWVGAGYTYTVAKSNGVEVGLGVTGAVGERSWRVGGELPIRYRVTESISLRCVPSLTRVIPRDETSKMLLLDDAESGALYLGNESPTAFTSVGVQMGFSIDFGGSSE